jgi:hypothetical protein
VELPILKDDKMNKEQKIDPTDQLEFYDNRKRHDVHLKKDHLKRTEGYIYVR